METKQLYPVPVTKEIHTESGQRGVYYAGLFVPVITVDGQLFTELSEDEAAARQNVKFPTEWDWSEDDTAACAHAQPWPAAPLDPETRTYESMMSATAHESARLLSNDRPLRLAPEDYASLRAEIQRALDNGAEPGSRN